ncbi:MAG: hypothetical protein CMC74_13700 [Flavobacteriaceae bacterium]|nr:hypothetical protein [Flavobacteriaceae bacterium]|tara:strand:- start:512 stop:895 length:384 start_codon:yes stop_codon:yes gene_type:complete
MSAKSIRFLVILLLVLSIVFGIHLLLLAVMGQPLFAHRILAAYVINFLLALVVLFLVQRSLQKNSAQAGFVFMAGSGLKFVVFFIVFYPFYRANDAMETIEFTTFFTPYAICLILEVAYLSKQLNNQ